MQVTTTAKIAIADDHGLLCNALAVTISQIKEFQVLYTALNGKELIEKIEKSGKNIPNIVIMDVRMSPMGGREATKILAQRFPSIKVIALSMYEDKYSMIDMFRAGARAYLLKNTDLEELSKAIHSVLTTGYYLTNITGDLFQAFQGSDHKTTLSPMETEFLHLAATNLIYKEIAEKMNVSERTVNGYRESVFKKLHLKNRVDLVLYCVINKII